ncbi:regulator of G-protein signaling 20 isoform X1 [Sturnira hondurensis]|uniref:regulator of G-protein signaling 20 isoform X1 n=1 Tax=Sturnira hondurensis TaxID=192404 RepID=UPI00187AA364|nr:regulator of G-protein signaling 20 isoform X1 [Sturnira hondurensis]
MPRLSQDNPECIQKHFSSPSMWKQCLPLPRAEGYNANIHQTTRKEESSKAVCDIKPVQIIHDKKIKGNSRRARAWQLRNLNSVVMEDTGKTAQHQQMFIIVSPCSHFQFPDEKISPTPDLPSARKLLTLLSSTLYSLVQFFSHLLRRSPPETPQRRSDFSLLLSARPGTGLLRGSEEWPGRLSLLLWAALTLPGRGPGKRLPQEEDASVGQRSFIPLMGSERIEMRKRQMSAALETSDSLPGQHGMGNRGSNACCFCWCCCCSCSCLTVRNQGQTPRTASHELRRDDIPNHEESTTPTLEEVSSWAQSFDKLMLTPAGRNAFREFLRTEFSEENMLFWMACEELKKEANKSIIEEKARIIYEDYISILSPKEVSLDSRVREVINKNMVQPSQHIFSDAQLQIYTLMHRDSYPRFMNSAVYKDLLQSLSEKSAEA